MIGRIFILLLKRAPIYNRGMLVFHWIWKFCLVFLVISGLRPEVVVSQGQPGRGPLQRNLDTTETVGALGAYEFNLGSTLDKILEGTADTDPYDAVTISNLRRLKEDAQPENYPDDLDPYRTRRIVEKALAIQSGNSISRLIQQSELRPLYRAIKQEFFKIREHLKFSLQSGSDGLIVSRKPRGQKLLELNLELNLKQGMDPQIRIGESFKFRYDYVDKVPVLEYGFAF